MKNLFTFLFACALAGSVQSQGLTLPYYTGYDTPAELAGWRLFRTGFLSASSWSVGGGGFSAPSCVSHDYNVGGATNDTVVDWFVSPAMNFTTGAQMTLKVSTAGFSTPFPDSFEIWFGTNDPNPATGNFTLVANLSFMLPQFSWLDTSINLPFTTDSGYIALKYKTIGAAWSTYAVDNIFVLPNPSATSEQEASNLSVSFYPNPIVSSAVIVSSSGLRNAVFEIFEPAGRLVSRIENINGHEILIDRKNFVGGIYFYRLTQEGKQPAAGKFLVE